ncbi:MAG TPA: redoxin domain-containing protein, partial [Phycisphaerae bacterium]|nr:redoxin domain-containing protein [Phycisphaerae bacterium]
MKRDERALLLDLKRDDKVAKGKIRLKVVDESGEPVAGALVGRHASWDDLPPGYPGESGFHVYAMSNAAKRTGKRGAVLLRHEDVFQRGLPKDFPTALVVIHEGRKIGVMGAVVPTAAGRSGLLTLQPLTRVYGKLTSTSLAKLGRKLYWTSADVNIGRLEPLSCGSGYRRYDMLVPPGKYLLGVDGNDTFHAWKKLTIKPGQRSIRTDLDLPADRLARLYGKRAPELKGIQGWNKFGPTTLKELRGKVVLLDFWGYWCGPCVYSIPNLMELHDKYHDKGLEIIGIHDNSVKSMRQLSAKCREVKKELWGGRDIPFRVAIDGATKTHIPG